MFVSDTNHEIGRKYLVGGHRKRVNVALLRSVAVLRDEQFWGQIPDDSWFGSCRDASGYNSGDCSDSEVPKARVTLLSN